MSNRPKGISRHFWDSCARKDALTEEAAEARLTALASSPETVDPERLEVYMCTYGAKPHYHVGHIPVAQMAKRWQVPPAEELVIELEFQDPDAHLGAVEET